MVENNTRAATQATVTPLRPRRPDLMTFRTDGERFVYEELIRAQASLPDIATLGISVNVPYRVKGRTFIVDLLVMYEGRCAVIEVDGSSHTGRWAHDRSRDALLIDAGVTFVEHIDAVDAADPNERAHFVRRFLHRLQRA